MARNGPVVFETTGDRYTSGARIGSILWDGAGTTLVNGDVAVVRACGTNNLLWRAQYPDNIGINAGPAGIAAPDGFYVDRLDKGIVMVYLREEA